MSSNVRFVTPSTDTAEDAPQHNPSQEEGQPLRASFRSSSGGAGAAVETYPARSTDITRNMGFRNDQSLGKEERDRDGVVPPKVLSSERRDGHVEDEVVISKDPVHLTADGEGRTGGKGRKVRAGTTERDDTGMRNRNRHEKTTSDNRVPTTTTPEASNAAKVGGRVSASRDGRGHGDCNGSVRVAEARIELEAGLLGDIAAAATTGFSHQPSTARLDRDPNPPHLVQSSSQVIIIEGSISSKADKDGPIGSPGTLRKGGESASGDFGIQSHPLPPACSRQVTHESPSLLSAGSLGEVGCDGVVSAGAETGGGANEAAASSSFVSSSVPARFGRPESIAVGVDDDPSGSRRKGGGGSDANMGRDGNRRSQQQQAGFNFADGGLELGGSTAAVEAGNSPEIDRVLDTGCGNHGGRAGGCDPFSLAQDMMAGPASPYSQALHMILGFVVFVLVAAHKAGNGGVPGRSHVSASNSGSASTAAGTGTGTAGAGSSSGRRSSGTSGGRSDSTRRSSTDGGMRWTWGSDAGFTVTRPPFLRRLRVAWSKLWHASEKELATRWRAAGQALAALRQAWAALWMPPPHVEADILAEALASPQPFHWHTERGHESVTMPSSSSPDRWRRKRKTRQPSRGTRHILTKSSSSAQDTFARKDSAIEPCRKLGLHLLNLWGFRPMVGPGGGRGSRSRSRKFLLVLDLDETLVHCSPHLTGPVTRRLDADGRMVHVQPDLKVEIRAGAPSDRPACMHAWKRPHLDIFLGVVSRWYEIAVFTSGRRCIAEPLIDLIDSRLVIVKRFYRESCTRRDGGSSSDRNSGRARSVLPSRGTLTPSRRNSGLFSREGEGYTGVGGGGGIASPPFAPNTSAANAAVGAAGTGAGAGLETVKDLSVIGSEHFPLRSVLVDNQPRSVLQQANVLPIRSWFPKDSQDRQLLDLLPVLLALTSCQDVRSVLGLRPGVTDGAVGGMETPRVAAAAGAAAVATTSARWE